MKEIVCMKWPHEKTCSAVRTAFFPAEIKKSSGFVVSFRRLEIDVFFRRVKHSFDLDLNLVAPVWDS